MTQELLLVIDTNVLVSGMAYPGSVPGQVLRLWEQGAFAIALSQHIVDETMRVLPRVLKSAMPEEALRKLVRGYASRARMITPAQVYETQLRDTADAPVLGTLLASGADYLVTGDKDLLALRHKYPVITPAEFWEKYG